MNYDLVFKKNEEQYAVIEKNIADMAAKIDTIYTNNKEVLVKTDKILKRVARLEEKAKIKGEPIVEE